MKNCLSVHVRLWEYVKAVFYFFVEHRYRGL